jgi:hypothetical protein
VWKQQAREEQQRIHILRQYTEIHVPLCDLALDPLRILVSAYGFHPDLYNEKSFEEGRPFPSARYT